MNRCTSHLASTFLALTAAALMAASPASAETTTTTFAPTVRHFPAAALRGELVVTTPPGITLDGKADSLSPGARIHGLNNMLVLSGALVNQTLTVNYLRESAGLVHEVWILNSEEILEKRPNTKDSWFSWGSSTATTTP